MATTYVPTSGIHVEELPTVTSAADSDGMIINSGNSTLSQITVTNLMKGVQDQIDTLSSDLTDLRPQRVSTAGTNLDDYTSFGIYFFSSTYTPTNIPSGSNGWLVVLPAGADGTFPIKQLWFRQGTVDSNDYFTYVRIVSASTGAGTWRRFAMVGVDVTSLSTLSEDDLDNEAVGDPDDIA